MTRLITPKKGWKANKSRQKYYKALEDHKNAKGVSKIGTWIKKTIADDVSQYRGDWEITSDKDFKESKEKQRERLAAEHEATKRFIEKQSSLILKELGYEDTKKAREFIRRWT